MSNPSTCGTCKDCRFWGVYRDQECDSAGYADPGDHLQGNRLGVVAVADDDQGLEAYLKTGPDFGCVHFQPKTT